MPAPFQDRLATSGISRRAVSKPSERGLVDYEVVIEPDRNWLRIDWKSLVEFRDLLRLLVRRDFVSKYKQTVLGPAWFVLQPLLMTVVFTIFFNQVGKISTDGLPPVLFYLCGLLGWNYFAQNVTAGSATFTANAGLFAKVYFPRLIVPLSIILSNLAAYALQLVTFLGFFLYYKFAVNAAVQLSPAALLLPLLVLQTSALSLGTSLWMSSLTAKYRDLTHLMQFIIQIWMFASFVIIPLSAVPERWRWLTDFNPMATIVEAHRFCLLGTGSVTLVSLGLSAAITGLVLLSGVFIFQRTERTFIDTV